MTRLPENVFARCFLLLLLMQQATASVAMAAAKIQLSAGDPDIATMAHDCASMGMQSEGHVGSHTAGLDNGPQHEHQDCIDAGCDDCVGCVVCAIGYRNAINLFVSGQPIVAPVSVVASIPEPDLLYRPPISD